MITDTDSASYWISSLSLAPHPEGGFFKETYRSVDLIPSGIFDKRFEGPRNMATGIYYLLESGDFSAFHRIRSDEMWHFYAGGALALHVLHEGRHQMIRLGQQIHEGEVLQYVVPAGAWFAATPVDGAAYSLLGCTVSPGFDFADFEMANPASLTRESPHLADLISRLSR
jgi:predicted cupin superfamily sugar epimerase